MSGVFLTSEDLEEIEAKVKQWREHPELISEWARDMSMKSCLILEKVMLRADGRRAAQDISVSVDRLTRMVQAMAQVGLVRPELVAPKSPQELTDGEANTETENDKNAAESDAA